MDLCRLLVIQHGSSNRGQRSKEGRKVDIMYQNYLWISSDIVDKLDHLNTIDPTKS